MNGRHCDTKLEDMRDASCINCHDPHYQPSRARSKIRADRPGPPPRECGACHAEREKLPDPSKSDERCMSCHRQDQEVDGISLFCFQCHGRSKTAGNGMVKILDVPAYAHSSHAGVSCLSCHPQAIEFVHGKQRRKDCRACHSLHPERVAHDAHLTVDCEACHLRGEVVRDPDAGRIRRRAAPGVQSAVHNMVRGNEERFCRRCHHRGNALGAAAVPLPARSVICMPCHTATLSAGDAVSVLSLTSLVIGLFIMSSVWFSGIRLKEEGGERPRKKQERFGGFSLSIAFSRVATVIRSLFLDAFLQGRLYRQSPLRWSIHALILFSFFLRFQWGLIALILSNSAPSFSVTWVMIDKNHPVTATFFEVTGLLIVGGILLAVIRGARKERVPHLPGRDWMALGLMGGIMVAGFIMEGMRMAMTGAHGHGAFLGAGIARLVSGAPGLPGCYEYMWYAHAVCTGMLVAYLPFSSMFHMVIAPVALAMRALDERARKERRGIRGSNKEER